MTNHIPPEKLLPQDMVVIYDHGPKDEPHETPVALPMHASDAKHAMSVEPERYALDPRASEPEPEPEPEPKLELVTDDELVTDFGQDGEEV